MMNSESTAIQVEEPSTHSKGKTPIAETPLMTPEKTIIARGKTGGWKKGVAILDFILRLCAIAAALGAAGTMGTTNQTLPFFTQFFQFQASYDDLPAFTFFVVANAITSGYLFLSLPFSIVGIIRPHAIPPRMLLITFDVVALTLTTAAGSAAAAIVYLAHNGNSSANWVAICQQFDNFCQRISGAVVASFVAAMILVLLVVLSALALKRH